MTAIVPCYNEEEVIETTHRRLLRVIDSAGWDGEKSYVNDGSADDAASMLRESSNGFSVDNGK